VFHNTVYVFVICILCKF